MKPDKPPEWDTSNISTLHIILSMSTLFEKLFFSCLRPAIEETKKTPLTGAKIND